MTLENYVKLLKDQETILRFKPGSFQITPRTLKDPVTKAEKTVRAVVLDVIEENGAPVAKTFSTLSEKLAAALETAHANGTLYSGKVAIKPVGEGFRREYQIRFS